MKEFPKELIVGKYRLKLLPASMSLACELYNVFVSDAENMFFWMPSGLPKSVDDVFNDLVSYDTDKQYCMYYTYDKDVLLGQIGFSRIGWRHGVGTIGYWLKKEARGKGVVRSILPEIERLGFETFELRKLIIECDGKNMPSRKIAEKNGYTLDAFCRQDIIWPDGTIRDNCEYSKLKSEWEKGKQR